MKRILTLMTAFMAVSPLLWAQNFGNAQVNPFMLSDEGSRVAPALADINNDNDPDLFAGFAGGNLAWFENVGFTNSPVYSNFTNSPFGLTTLSGDAAPELGDLDNDGDLDMMAGSDSGLRYFQNDGNAASASFSAGTPNPFNIISPSGNVKPALVDIDSDDDLDLFVGASDGNIYFYENTGTTTIAVFAQPDTNVFGFFDVGSRSAPAFADIDNDGDYDCIVGAEDGNLYFFKNTGSPGVPSFTSTGANPSGLSDVGSDAQPTFGDVDGDNDDDLLVGNASGDFHFFENQIVTGIAEQERLSVTISPNPATDVITVHFQEPLTNATELQLTDLNGRVVAVQNVASGNKLLNVPVHMLQQGLYVVQLQREGERQLIDKVMIE